VILADVDPVTRAALERYGFDAERFERLRSDVAAGVLSPESNVVRGQVEPPRPGDAASLPEPDSAAWDEARTTGLDALRAGLVAQIVLAGGMATRFGGVVKGAVQALDGKSFLEWKLGETARLAAALGTEIPVAVMTSFATDATTRAHVAERNLPEPLWFSQYVSLRLTPHGDLFREADGRPSLYGPGHGDLLEALRRSGTLDRLRAHGVRHVAVSNVDNLGARLDPVVLGAHVVSGAEMTSEVAAKEGDAGGAPARVDGRLGLLELPQFPPSFDHGRISVFNTNSATFALDALDRDFDLPWLYVEKTVGGRRAVQLERLYHHASWTLATRFLEVPRTGPRGRFFPIKEPEDLERAQTALRTMLDASPLDG
jgi:UTP--glucose-1-phosphate uridylyltransferase